jgi:putative ABC transport system permease protein
LWLIEHGFDARAAEELSGDLAEEFALRAARHGRYAARAWFWRQVLSALIWRQGARTLESGLGGRSRPMRELKPDIVYAIRTLRRSPGFAAAALVTLAVGIGATTAIFGAVDAMLLRPLPYRHADRLFVPVSAHPARGIDEASITFADHLDWRRETEVFDVVALWRPVTVDLTGDGEPERAQAGQVSEEFFRLVEATPLTGRTFTPSDHVAEAARVTVISHALWQRRFGAAGDVVGRTLRVAGVPHEIVGILPPRSVWPENITVFLPIRPALLSDDVRTRRDNMIYLALARLRDGVTRDRADAVLATIAARLEVEHPESRKGWTNRLVPLREFIVEEPLRRALVVLLAAVGGVLLLACANLANLALVRGIGRARELGVRVALGASRWRILRQLAVESLVIGALGGAAGAVVAAWMMSGLVAMAPAETPFIDRIGLDPRVLTATGVFTLIAVLLAGIIPAIASSAVSPGRALKDGTARAGSSRRTERMRGAFVVAEIAGAVVLLTGAALLIRSFERAQRVDPGVDVDSVLAGRLSLPGARYGTDVLSADFFQRLTVRLASVPDVEAAAATSFVPVGGGGFGLGRVFLAEGRPEPPAGQDVSAQWNVITPDYFRAMGIPIIRGRSFEARDRADTTPVVIVSQSFASQMFGDADPTGKRIRSWRDENLLREIVGVVDEVRYTGLTDRGPFRQVYVPHPQNSWNLMSVVVRAASGSPADLAPVLRREVAAIDPDLALANVQTLTGIARDSIARERYTTLLLSALAVTALLLGAVGIYGVISFAVSARRHEFGVRIALGASGQDLYRLVLGQGARLTVVGLGLGLAGAFSGSQLITALLYETEPTDPTAYAATVLAVLTAAGLACVLPARRAARSNPVDALRSE